MNHNNQRMLITGVSGLLGNNLAYYFKDKYQVLGLYCSHPVTIAGVRTDECDLLHEGAIKQVIQTFEPSIIIHCASLASVDKCEEDPKITDEINVLTTRRIVETVLEKDVKLVYISTDAVYDGVKGHFSEDDDIAPANHYGRSKYEGELEVQKKQDSLVLRTNLFGWNIQDKKSLGEWILDELKAGRQIEGFKDACFSTIYTLELARVIDVAIRNQLSGTHNCGGADSCSKLDFARKIADRFGFDKTMITSISVDDFQFKAKRGKSLSLDVNRLQKSLDYSLPTIDQSIDQFYRDYKCGFPQRIRLYQSRAREISSCIPYGRQSIDEGDIQAVVRVLRSDRITQGPKVEEFEQSLAKHCDVKYAVAVSSGTSALHIACLAAGVSTEDEVITSPNTFVASANCIVYCGARPIFADIDPDTYNISPEEIAGKITPRTRAVIPVHFAGQSCDMEAIQQLAKTAQEKHGHKIHIIEDACHALGSLYKDKKVGSCAFSDMAVTSFHPVKHITTGEGGAVLTNDEALCAKLKRLRSHGTTSDPSEFIDSKTQDPWHYEQIDLGYNYRITDIQCSLGVSQLRKLPRIIERRREIVDTYNSLFADVTHMQVPFEAPECRSNFHLYVPLFDFEKTEIGRTGFMAKLKDKGIRTQVHYIPVHTQPYYRKKFGTNWGDCPNVEKYYQKCLSIPLFPAMTDQDTEKVIDTITDVIGKSAS